MFATVTERRIRWFVVAVPLLTALAGAMIAVAPLGAMGLAAAFASRWHSAAGGAMRTAFFVVIVILLAGYAFLGRGFAYLGVAPSSSGKSASLVGMLPWLRRSRAAG